MNTLNRKEYNTLHQWVLRHYSKAGKCSKCLQTCKTQWSNKSGLYFKERADWQELCPKCHRDYDTTILGVKFGRQKGARKHRRVVAVPVPVGFDYNDL